MSGFVDHYYKANYNASKWVISIIGINIISPICYSLIIIDMQPCVITQLFS